MDGVKPSFYTMRLVWHRMRSLVTAHARPEVLTGLRYRQTLKCALSKGAYQWRREHIRSSLCYRVGMSRSSCPFATSIESLLQQAVSLIKSSSEYIYCGRKSWTQNVQNTPRLPEESSGSTTYHSPTTIEQLIATGTHNIHSMAPGPVPTMPTDDGSGAISSFFLTVIIAALLCLAAILPYIHYKLLAHLEDRVQVMEQSWRHLRTVYYGDIQSLALEYDR